MIFQCFPVERAALGAASHRSGWAQRPSTPRRPARPQKTHHPVPRPAKSSFFRWDFQLHFIFGNTPISALWVDSWPRPKSNGRGKIIWEAECQVYRPLFTGSPSELGSQGKFQVYQSLITDSPLATSKFTDLPLQIASYRQMAKKCYFKWETFNFNLFVYVY